MYFDFLEPNNFQNDTDFLRDELVLTLLRAVGISQEYALAQLLEQYYYEGWQIGDLKLMTPGTIDVSISGICFITNCSLNFVVGMDFCIDLFQMLSTFFLKASSYKMVQENSKYENSYWYSIEHESSKKSVYNLLFSSQKPAHIENPGQCSFRCNTAFIP